MKITKKRLAQIIREETANMLSEQGRFRSRSSLAGGSDEYRGGRLFTPRGTDLTTAYDDFETDPEEDAARALELAIAADRRENPQSGPRLAGDSHARPAWADTFPGQGPLHQAGDTAAPPIKDPRPDRSASLDPVDMDPARPAEDIYQVQLELNKAKNSGAITVATWRKARRALQGSPRKNRLLDKIHGAGFADRVNAGTARAILDAGMAGSSVTTATTDLKESYEVVPGSGEEGVSGLVDPLQSMESEEELERQELADQAAARKQRALAWKLTQDEKGQGQPTRATANTKDTSGLRQAEFEDVYAKLYTLHSGEDIGQPGDAGRVPDSFAERKPRGSDEDFIQKSPRVTKAALEEIIREEVMAHPAITSWGDKRLKQLAKKKKAARDRRAYEDRVARAKEEPGFQWALEADDEGWGPGSLEEMIREETEAVLAEVDPKQDAPGLKGYSERETNREASCKTWKAQGKSLPDWCDEYI